MFFILLTDLSYCTISGSGKQRTLSIVVGVTSGLFCLMIIIFGFIWWKGTLRAINQNEGATGGFGLHIVTLLHFLSTMNFDFS